MKINKTIIISVMSLLFLFPYSSSALDVIKINRGHSEKDTRHFYKWEVLTQALELTKPDFGEYSLEITGQAIPNHQRLKELELSRYLNVAMSLTNIEWEERIPPIKIPVRLEAMQYRLMLIDRKNIEKFSQVKTLADLQKFRAGVRQSWATKDVLLKNNFTTLPAYSYEALFAMLSKGRFDFLLRGVHEIYPEYEARKNELHNIVIEPNLVVEIPNSYYYVFVSPKQPRIKERLTKGLLMMTENGDLKRLFDKYYGEFFRKANISQRTKITFTGLDLESPK